MDETIKLLYESALEQGKDVRKLNRTTEHITNVMYAIVSNAGKQQKKTKYLAIATIASIFGVVRLSGMIVDMQHQVTALQDRIEELEETKG